MCQLNLDVMCDMAKFDGRALEHIEMECLHHAVLLLMRRMMVVEAEFEARGHTAYFDSFKGQVKSMLKHEKSISRINS